MVPEEAHSKKIQYVLQLQYSDVGWKDFETLDSIESANRKMDKHLSRFNPEYLRIVRREITIIDEVV